MQLKGSVETGTSEAAPPVPGLVVLQGTTTAHIPDDLSDYPDDCWFTMQENGSVTLESFQTYLEVVLLPYIKASVPGGLKKGEREALITMDMPRFHWLE